MTTTGKRARKMFGTRAAAKRAKRRHHRGKKFGHLMFSEKAGNVEQFRTGRI
jgi:hypothetical protein